MDYTVKLVSEWFEEKCIIQKSNIEKQFIKYTEEAGEAAAEILAGNIEKALVEIGDMLVTINGMCMFAGIGPCSVIEKTYPTGYYSSEFVALAGVQHASGAVAEDISKSRNPESSLKELVVAIELLCNSLDIDMGEALLAAYTKITARDGEMVDGFYVKKGDI